MANKFENKTVLDCHTHAGYPDIANRRRKFEPYEQLVRELDDKMSATGVNGAIVFPFPNTSYYDPDAYNQSKQLIPSGLQPFPYAIENQELLDQCKDRKNFYPFACVDPSHETEQQLRFLNSAIKGKNRIYGLKLHGYAVQGSALDLAHTGFVDFALENNLPIIFHSGRDDASLPVHGLELAKQFPKLRIDLAHFALFDDSILEQVGSYPNVYIDSCPLLYLQDMAEAGSKWVTEPNHIVIDSPSLTLLEYYQRLQGQFMWGTDEPWTRMVTPDGIVRSDHDYVQETDILKQLEKIMPEAVRSIANDATLNFLFG
jgi:predicted TIM-barrel fold metal-dependent hydrolase